MMRIKIARVSLPIIVCGVFLMACEHRPLGIYASISRSREISRPNEGDRGYPSSMLKHGNRYYATAKQLFVRDSNAHGSDWQAIALPPGYDVAVAIRAIGGTLVVAVTASGSGNSALYELRAGDSWGSNLYRCDRNSSGLCGASSPPETSLQTLSEQIVWMDVAPFSTGAPRLFLLTKGGTTPRSYVLYYYNRGPDLTTLKDDRLHTVWNPVSLLHDIDTVGNYIVFSDRTSLYCLNDNRMSGAGAEFTGLNQNPALGNQSFLFRTLVVSSGEDKSAITIGGLLRHEGALHVSGGNGQIFRYSGNAVCQSGWRGNCSSSTSTTTNCWSKSSYAGNFRYTDMVWFAQLTSSSVGGIAIGVEDAAGHEGGYRQIKRSGMMDIADLNASGISDPGAQSNYRASRLSITTVSSFFVDDDSLFALTAGYGIWRATYTNGLPSWRVDLSR